VSSSGSCGLDEASIGLTKVVAGPDANLTYAAG
jgi:hypothetical protein